MPSTMIHLSTAYYFQPASDVSFLIGSNAPDSFYEREVKDAVHLRNVPCRLNALEKLKAGVDINNPFEKGWLLHLFADYLWDEKHIPAYRKYLETNYNLSDWFHLYRDEIGQASYYLYHNLPWAKQVFEKIKSFDVKSVQTSLPITHAQIEFYRNNVVKKHEQSSPDSFPDFFKPRILNEFAFDTAKKFEEWLKKPTT